MVVTASPMRPDSGSHSFYPLTFPITIGPGSISVAMTLGAGARDAVTSVTGLLGVALGILLVSATIYLCYRFAARLLRRLGRSGTGVLLRLSAFILLSIGVQILCDGVAERFRIPASSL
jgi:multiple antibiotic resistance protein